MKPRGFTLLEVLLTIAILALVAAMGLPLYQGFQVRNDLALAEINSVHAMRRAQSLSRASKGDSAWGVKWAAGSITIFKGSTYAGRDTTEDETISANASITPSGFTEIVFAKFTGLPGSTGTLTLTTASGLTETVTINAKGMLTY